MIETPLHFSQFFIYLQFSNFRRKSKSIILIHMSNTKFKVHKFQINQLVRIGGHDKLPQLNSYQQTLEVQLPNMQKTFNTRFPFKSEKVESEQRNQEQDRINNLIVPRSRIKQVYQKVEDDPFKKMQQPKITFYNIVKMLFPQPSGLSPLVIDVIDTIFYNQDGSMTYVCTDSKKGLIKTKAKNYIQVFFKRKAQVDLNFDYFQKTTRKSVNNFQQLTGNWCQQKNQYLKNLDYVALLRYKDQTFIRLKQHEFKSIFIRPVQANQKYKISNALYLQLIPQQVNYKQGTIFPIQFVLQKHINTQVFQKAVDKHCQETSYNKCRVSDEIKRQIKQISIQAFLFYIIFQIYAYINIHHHKQITYGIFQFMRVNDTFYLSNTRKIKLNQSQNIKNQYTSHNLFEQFIEEDNNFKISKESVTTGVLKAIDQLFDQQNKKITQEIKSFVQRKLDQIEDKDDNISSNEIFHSINQKQNKNLHQLLEDEVQYQKFIRKKQQQLDGFSPLTSISNICKKKYKKINITLDTKDSKEQKSTQAKEKKSKNYFSLIQKPRESKVSPWSKWYKQTLNGKKQYYHQK